MTTMDWAQIGREAVGHLQALLRFNTVNPPGNELQVAEYLLGVCRDAGIEAAIYESAPGRGNFVARIRVNLKGAGF